MSTSAGGDRRLPLALLAALVLVAAVAATWLRRDPPPDPPFPADLGVLSPPQADFVDADHGYLLLGRCPRQTCEAWVGVTHDGGQSWHAAAVPGLPFEGGEPIDARLITLDADRAIIEGFENFAVTTVVDERVASARPPSGRRWYTSDGGRTWSPVRPDPVATLDEIPTGARAFATLSDGPSQRIVVRLVRLDGTSAVLGSTPTPSYRVVETEVVDAPDGSHWVVTRGTGTTTVFRSQDRGRTWAPVPWPAGHPAEDHRYGFYAGDGVTVYLVDEGSFRAWRSRDAGGTWEPLVVPFSAGIPDAGLSGMSLPDGRLLLYQPLNALFVSTVTGSTFEPADPALAFTAQGRALVPSADGSVAIAGADGSRLPLPFACLGGRCSW